MHFLLVHSPVVGPTTWSPVANVLRERGHVVDGPSLVDAAVLNPPSPRLLVQRAAKSVTAGPDEVITVVTHSNAGIFGPAIGRALSPRQVLYIFVDAPIPPSQGTAEIAPPEFLAHLREIAVDGLLPPWTEWWDEADVTPMLPADQQLRDALIAEQPRLPLSYYEQTIYMPEGWDEQPCAYIYFGPPYDDVASELGQRGWAIRHVPGLHLNAVIAPDAVADAIVDVVTELQP